MKTLQFQLTPDGYFTGPRGAALCRRGILEAFPQLSDAKTLAVDVNLKPRKGWCKILVNANEQLCDTIITADGRRLPTELPVTVLDVVYDLLGMSYSETVCQCIYFRIRELK